MDDIPADLICVTGGKHQENIAGFKMVDQISADILQARDVTCIRMVHQFHDFVGRVSLRFFSGCVDFSNNNVIAFSKGILEIIE